MTADFFAALGLARTFQVDLTELEKRYFEAQRRFHPDRLVGKSPAERQHAISQSMLANEAYETLKEPLKRARHLLLLAGLVTDSVKPSQALLIEIMETREALADADSASRESLAQQNARAKEEVLTSLGHAFANSDSTQAAELTMRLSYLVKIEDEIRVKRIKPLS